MFCRACRYELRGLTGRRCPECGRAFAPGDPSTYLTPRDVVRIRRDDRLFLTFVVLTPPVVLLMLGSISMLVIRMFE